MTQAEEISWPLGPVSQVKIVIMKYHHILWSVALQKHMF